MRKAWMFLFIIMMVITGFWSCQRKVEDAVEPIVPVRVYQVRPDTIATNIEITGTLEAVNDAVVVSKISEKLNKIRKQVGSRVQKDEVIAILENRILKEGLNQAKAALASAEARYAQVKQDYQRYQRLYKEKAISQQQWEKMQSTMQEVEAALNQMKAAYEQANERFKNSFIRAPFDGIVGSIYFDEGEMVPVGQPVAKIINTALMKAKLYVPDIYLSQLQQDQTVIAEFPSLPEKKFQGKINRIDPAIDPLSRTVQVEVLFENKAGELASGLYGLFKIEARKKTNTIVLPDNAVLTQTEINIDPETGETIPHRKYYVFVIQGETVRLTPVEVGLESGERVEIVRGLNHGDRVVVVGQRIVRDGQKVKIIE